MTTTQEQSKATSKFQTNVSLQPSLIQEILVSPKASWMETLKLKRVFFVGIGTSYYGAEIAKCIWRQFISPNCHAVHSFDFVRQPQPIGAGDVAVLFSHRGTKTYTLEAAHVARSKGLITIGIVGKNSSWQSGLAYRLETCEQEDT